MFTGIVEALGEVVAVRDHGTNRTFTIRAAMAGELKVDQSVAHDGVCLTVVAVQEDRYEVTAVLETLSRTNLGTWAPGSPVGLERCLLTGDFIDARKACDAGMVAEVTADGQALPTALAMANRIAANSPLAVALAKDAALVSFETPLAQGLEHEKRNFLVALRSADNLEGQAAFLSKRTPHFTGQ